MVCGTKKKNPSSRNEQRQRILLAIHRTQNIASTFIMRIKRRNLNNSRLAAEIFGGIAEWQAAFQRARTTIFGEKEKAETMAQIIKLQHDYNMF